MLGERKTRGVFNEGKNSEWGSRMQELMPTQAAPVEPVAREPVEVVSKSADDLFFAAVEGKDFATVLQEVQEHIASRYSSLLTDGNNDDVKRQMKRYITGLQFRECQIRNLLTTYTRKWRSFLF